MNWSWNSFSTSLGMASMFERVWYLCPNFLTIVTRIAVDVSSVQYSLLHALKAELFAMRECTSMQQLLSYIIRIDSIA